MESRGGSPAEREEAILGVRLPLDRGGRFWQRVAQGESVISDDVRGTSAMAAAYRRFVGSQFDSNAIRYIRSFLAVPLRHRDQVIGLLTLSKSEPRFYTARHAYLASAIAVHAATAIANARLFEDARSAQAAAARQVERLQALMAITRELLVATKVERVLDLVVVAATRLVTAMGATVGLVPEDGEHITVAASAGESLADGTAALLCGSEPLLLEHAAIGEVLTRGEPVVFDLDRPWCPTNPSPAISNVEASQPHRRVVIVPMLVDGTSIGILRVHDHPGRTFTADDLHLIQALADQGALAVSHARLLTRDNDAAVLEERARLARDLHDSVTQSLFSLGMLARAAHLQHERHDDRLHDTLARIASLAQDSVVEMRALLFELHPASLVEKGLSQALADLVEAAGRDGTPQVTFTTTTNVQPDVAMTEAMFRIAQEALANARKHAHATVITVTLAETDGHVVLTIADNGVGFDPAVPRPGSADGGSGGMGLWTMRDRALAAGMLLTVHSTAGLGTVIHVKAPIPDRGTATSASPR
jgi:signal transduction histidine kinase